MSENNFIQLKYLRQSQVQQYLADIVANNYTPLLLLEHSQKLIKLTETKSEIIHLLSGLQSIDVDKESAWCELWFAKGSWKRGVYQNSSNTAISFYQNEDLLLGSLSIPLTAKLSLQEVSRIYYTQLIHLIHSQNKPHLIRMWNYFPDINAPDSLSKNSLERYQQFCVGRHFAFADVQKYPAASAVGSQYSDMVILFIAVKQDGIFLENPEQISAYHYPQQYSPKSPSFARAAVYPVDDAGQLYISGTASIVGHKSRFINDISDQTKQTIKNLQTLINYANEQLKLTTVFKLNATLNCSPAIKVYLRKADDFQQVSHLIQEFVPDCENICFVQADICRQELDIEIEILC